MKEKYDLGELRRGCVGNWEPRGEVGEGQGQPSGSSDCSKESRKGIRGEVGVTGWAGGW